MIQAHRIDAGGVKLHVEERGSGAPLVLLHGFTGSTRAMTHIAEGLSDTHRTLSIDLVGHGRSESPRDPAAYTMSACVVQLVAVLDALDVSCADWIGYSMGGRVALALAVSHPARVSSALLVGASAGIRDAQQRNDRVRADEALAERIERDGVESFVDFWVSQPFLFDAARLGAGGLAEARELRLTNSARGLASSLRGMGSGAQPPLHGALAQIGMPVCLAVGADDAKFRDLAAEICQELPNARLEVVPEAGHAAHTDNPAAFLDLARRFLLHTHGGPSERRHSPHERHPHHQTRTT